ncbi:MAG: dCTP deaminase [Gaiellaceae bacterium]|nr:dCTP deaminase [Gaiellaceae bacterium]
MTLLHHEALEDVLVDADWDKRLVVTPLLDRQQIGEASIDLRLGTDFLLLKKTLHAGVELVNEEEEEEESVTPEQLQARVDSLYDRRKIAFGDGLWLHPQQFALGATLEFVRLPPTLGAYVLSRSSWGRLGLLVATAVMVQPRFAGALTLELVNEGESPIKLYPGVKIAQLAVHSLPSVMQFEKADPNYRWPTGPQPARLGKEQEQLEKIRMLGQKLATV